MFNVDVEIFTLSRINFQFSRVFRPKNQPGQNHGKSVYVYMLRLSSEQRQSDVLLIPCSPRFTRSLSTSLKVSKAKCDSGNLVARTDPP